MKKRINILLIVLLCCLFMPLTSQAKITLSKYKKTMNVGTSYKLKLKGTKKNGKWSNLSKNYLKMKKISKNKYKITALKVGTGKIKVKLKGKKYYCYFIVQNPYFTTKNIYIRPGQKATLQVLGSVNKKTFSSSKSSVAKVSSAGQVTGKAAGSTTISCKINNSTIKTTVTVCDINDKSRSMEMGEKFTLKISNYKGSVQWTSDNPEVAKVSSSGQVTAVKTGSTTVKGKCSLGEFTSKIKVVDYELSQSHMVIALGDSHKLTCDQTRVNPSYSSADPDIATVDEQGNVTALALGETSITSDVNGVTHSCTIVVKDQGLNYDKKTIPFSGFQLKVINWDGTITWKSSNPKVASVDENGYVTGYKRGNATITATISWQKEEDGDEAEEIESTEVAEETNPSDRTDDSETQEVFEDSFDCEITVSPDANDFFKAWQTVTQEMLKNSFKYGTGGNNYTTATSKKRASCAETVCFVLQRLGDLPNGYGFYCASDGQMKGDAAGRMKSSSYFKVYYPNKKEKDCDLQPGDIVGLSGGSWGHTQVYAGRNSFGNMLFYSGGTDAAVNGSGSLFSASKLPKARRISCYEDKYVRFIIRRK